MRLLQPQLCVCIGEELVLRAGMLASTSSSRWPTLQLDLMDYR